MHLFASMHALNLLQHRVYACVFSFAEAFIIFITDDQRDIFGRSGCNYERTCCTDTAGVILNWFGRGQQVGNSSNIIVTVSRSSSTFVGEMMVCLSTHII